MKRYISVLLCFSLILAMFSVCPVSIDTLAATEQINTSTAGDDYITVGETKSFTYANDKIISSGTAATSFAYNSNLGQPADDTGGWQGALVVSSISGEVTGPVAGGPQDNLQLEWINRIFTPYSNSLMIYVELPDFEKAGATWGLNIEGTFYVEQNGKNYWVNKSKPINYSYIGKTDDSWNYSATKTVEGKNAVFADLPSGFKGYIRIDMSSVKYHDAGMDVSKLYNLRFMGFGYNGVGGECGDLIFGGVLYFPDSATKNSTLLKVKNEYYQLGHGSTLKATQNYAKWNVSFNPTTTNVTGAEASCTGCAGSSAYGYAIDTSDGKPLTEPVYYSKLWPNINMCPGVDTFMLYVEMPTYTADTYGLAMAMPGLGGQNISYGVYVSTANSRYAYMSATDKVWKYDIMGANGEMMAIGSGFKGYIKIDIKDLEGYRTGKIQQSLDFNLPYTVMNIQLRFNHVGGENGKLLIGSLYSVLSDSDSGDIEIVTADTTTRSSDITASSVAVMQNADASTYTQDTELKLPAADLAEGFGGAYRLRGEGTLNTTLSSADLGNADGVLLYVEKDKAQNLNLEKVALTQGGNTFTADLSRLTVYSYMSSNDGIWHTARTYNQNSKNGCLSALPDGFKGYLHFDLSEFVFGSVSGNFVNFGSDYQLTALSLGYDAGASDLVVGGLLYVLARDNVNSTLLTIGERTYSLLKSKDSMQVTPYITHANGGNISGVSGDAAAQRGTAYTADCIVAQANQSLNIESISGDLVTDWQLLNKQWVNAPMTKGVDTYMFYVQVPNHNQSDNALRISSPEITGGIYPNSSNTRYSYMSIYDGIWRTAYTDAEGDMNEIGSGFEGYIKIDLKDTNGYKTNAAVRTALKSDYSLVHFRLYFRYVGGDAGNLKIGAIYSVEKDSDAAYIAKSGSNRLLSTRFLYGDINRDGKINATDTEKARLNILGLYTLDEDEKLRIDANLDGVALDVCDLVKMNNVAKGATEANRSKLPANTSGITPTSWLADGMIPYYPDGTVTLTDYDNFVMTSSGTSADTYNKYLKLLEYAGFTKYTSNTIGDNLFATYANENLAINVYYISSNSTTRVIWESIGKLPALEAENTYDKTTTVDSTVTGISVGEYEGAAYLFRLEDGSFIVYDGGQANGTVENGKAIYNAILAQTPEGEKPVIAAWIFSHAHSDHLGGFTTFSLLYRDKVTVERLVCNFPEGSETVDFMKSNSVTEYGAFNDVVAELYADVPVVKPYTGNKLYIRNATVEVLQTFDDFYPTTLAESNFNTTSTIYRIHIGGQSILMLGDATPASENKLLEQFGSYMKTDVLQLAHHGIDGTMASYQTYDPEYALLPASKHFYKQYVKNDATAHAWNRWLLNESENMKYMFVSGYGTFTVKLPITVTPNDNPVYTHGNGTYYSDDYQNPTNY
ncbi:MAG: MBL fold metallo-hydrolase [Clostridia bacterium]|nr:MBL fold metallo-hydrolase [Clostridia bacterium]